MNVQHLEVFANESRTMTLYARGPDNLPVNLSGKTIQWSVGRGPKWRECGSLNFTKAGTIVSAPAGSFTVTVAPSDTQYMGGDYQHQAKTLDGAGLKAVVTVGRFRVNPNLVT